MPYEASLCPDPNIFNPHRHNCDTAEGAKEQPNLRQRALGFCRRVCPGMRIAEASVFMQSAKMLAVTRMHIGLAVYQDCDDIALVFNIRGYCQVRIRCLEFKYRRMNSFDLYLTFDVFHLTN